MCARINSLSPSLQLPVSVYESVIDIINGEVRMTVMKKLMMMKIMMMAVLSGFVFVLYLIVEFCCC